MKGRGGVGSKIVKRKPKTTNWLRKRFMSTWFGALERLQKERVNLRWKKPGILCKIIYFFQRVKSEGGGEMAGRDEGTIVVERKGREGRGGEGRVEGGGDEERKVNEEK